MIDLSGMISIPFLKKSVFTGSYEGMRYLLRKEEVVIEMGNDEIPEKVEMALVAVIWPEPYNYQSTPEEEKVQQAFPFHMDGVLEAVAWLNQTYENGHYQP